MPIGVWNGDSCCIERLLYWLSAIAAISKLSLPGTQNRALPLFSVDQTNLYNQIHRSWLGEGHVIAFGWVFLVGWWTIFLSAYVLFQDDILTEITMWETPGQSRWGFASMSSECESSGTANVDAWRGLTEAPGLPGKARWGLTQQQGVCYIGKPLVNDVFCSSPNSHIFLFNGIQEELI